MKYNKIVLSVCLIFQLAFSANAQSIDTVLNHWYQARPTEKIYVQFDNNHYAPGQTIWFKAYLILGLDPSDISKNIYIDFFDGSGRLLEHSARPIVYGSSWGSFIIPEKYMGTSIQAVAYTKWMSNFDSAYFFRKQLGVIPTKIMANNTATSLPEATIQFLPEAGNLIEQVPTVMAFKAINQLGLPENISGVIKNKEGDSVVVFSSQHDGMGKFYFLPQPNDIYTAEWTDQLGRLHKTILPTAQPVGISVHFENGKLDRVFHIQRSASIPEAMKRLTVVAQIAGQVVFKAVANLSDKLSATSRIPVSQFPSSIVQVTIFDANNQPVAERLLFVNNQEYALNANIKFDTLNLNKREKNVFEIDIQDSTVTNLSLSITDGLTNTAPDNSIVSQLLLAGDLKGYIHHPAYYFSSDADTVSDHLDLVMLTNGWRRFAWKEIFNDYNKPTHFLRDTGYMNLLGKVEHITDAKIKKASLMNLILLSKDSSKTMLFLPLEPNGSFTQNNLIFFDTTKVFYKLNGTGLSIRSNVIIETNLLKADPKRILYTTHVLVDTTGYARMSYLANEQKKAELLKLQTTLKEVIVHSKVKTRVQELNEQYTSGLFANGDGYSFDMTDEISGQGVLAFLQGRVPGLTINNPFSIDASATWRGSSTSFYVNEFQAEADQVNTLSISDIAYVKVFRPPFFGGFGGGGGGAIAIYTKKGVDAYKSARGLDFIMVPGYAPIREFYSPNYAEQQVNFNTKDTRNTLLWNPVIRTDNANKKAKIVFYNNDISNSFRVVLEGMDSDGKMLHYSKFYQK
jgi:hypothetical protein